MHTRCKSYIIDAHPRNIIFDSSKLNLRLNLQHRETNFFPFFLFFQQRFLILAAIGKRKFEGLGQQGDPKRRFGIGNGGNQWGSQPLTQQPLNGAEQWYTDTYPTWS